MSARFSPSNLLADLRAVLIFSTRLPLAATAGTPADLGPALRLAPLAGLFVGAFGGAIFMLASWAGLSPLLSGLLCVLATMLLTGGLHEDGLADFADGLGSPGDVRRRLDIMRDSRTGAFGACALIFSIALRAAALMQIGEPALALLALVAAHSAGRGILAPVMAALPPAGGGFAATLRRPNGIDAGLSLVLTVVILLVVLGWSGGVAALVVLFAVTAGLAAIARRAVGGFTGDVLGALEQSGEIAVLVLCAAL